MAKRHRGAHRPGQRRPDRHVPGRQQPSPAARPPQGLTADEEARAADLESRILAQERSAQVDRPRPDAAVEVAAPRASSPLALKAAAEYGYVSRDVRRILRIGGSMVGLLAVVFVLVRILHVVNP